MGEKLLCLAPVVLLALLQVGVDAQRYGRSFSENQMTCGLHTCGVGAHCFQAQPVCVCPAGHTGDPLSQCIRGKGECVVNSECPSHQACLNHNCVNLCEETCGINANCNVVNHIPLCSCPAGYTGNAFSTCFRVDPEDACHPSPCGSNTKCHVANNQATCTCLPGYIGSPLTGCRHECDSDGECGAQQSCRDFKCVSPSSDCAVNADCETVAAHRAEEV